MALRAGLVLLSCMFALTYGAPSNADVEKLKTLKSLVDETEKDFPTRSVEEVEGYRCGYFEIIEGKSLFGFNTRTVYDKTQQECMEACVSEYNFYCRSADYNPASSTCYLSSESDETQPQDFDVNFNTNYFRRLCEMPTSEPEPHSGSGWWYYG